MLLRYWILLLFLDYFDILIPGTFCCLTLHVSVFGVSGSMNFLCIFDSVGLCLFILALVFRNPVVQSDYCSPVFSFVRI